MTTTVEDSPAVDLLSQVPITLADLSRDGGGYSIQVIYLPDIEHMADTGAEAHITIIGGKGETLDTLTIPAAEGVVAFRHPSGYSHKLRDYLAPPKGKAAAN